jgi:hypothetical protein
LKHRGTEEAEEIGNSSTEQEKSWKTKNAGSERGEAAAGVRLSKFLIFDF